MKVQSVNRTLDIIEYLSLEANGCTLTEISNKVDLPLSTIFRLLNNLVDRGYIEKQSTGIYRIGMKFTEITSLYLSRLELKTEANPFLYHLSQKLGLFVFMAINTDEQVCYIDRVGVRNVLRNFSIIGQRRSLFSTALGKALLLGYSPNELREYVQKHSLVQITPKTIVDHTQLIEDLEISRKRGWAYDNEEDQLGFRCIATPIKDYRSTVVASISVSWHKDLFDTVDETLIAQMVVETGQQISKRLGCLDSVTQSVISTEYLLQNV